MLRDAWYMIHYRTFCPPPRAHSTAANYVGKSMYIPSCVLIFALFGRDDLSLLDRVLWQGTASLHIAMHSIIEKKTKQQHESAKC